MSINITMPALSPTMEEGNLAKWLVKEGDVVSAGDVIAEIETDKATMEVEAVDEGIIAKLLVEAGSEGVKVNSVIALLAEDGEDALALDEPAVAPSVPSVDVPGQTVEVSNSSSNEARAHGKPDVAEPVQKKRTDAKAEFAPAEGERLFATPLARRLAEQRGVDLASVRGSGPGGRIVKSDIPEHGSAKTGERSVKDAASRVVKNPDDRDILALFEDGSYEPRPHDGMRRTIAERLTQSTQTVPAYFITVECRLDNLLDIRQQMNAGAPQTDGKPNWKISVNDFVVKAMALALRDVPMANASWTSEARIMHAHSDVGVAVAVEDGLFTPIVRKAEQKTLSTISAEIKDLASRARSKRLKPNEYQGGTTAVSNLGMFGVKEFTSIINPPHASILSVGVGEQRPVIDDGELAIATVMGATFAFDHRVIDGALGAELAAAFKTFLEYPMAMLA